MLSWIVFVLYWSWWAILGSLKLVIWVICALLFGLWWVQGQFLYMPTYHAQNSSDPKGTKRGCAYNRVGYRSPAEVSLPFEDVMIRTSDGVNIHAWFITQDDTLKGSCPTIIFFHGNAGNIGYRTPNARSLFQHTKSNVLLVDYRSYGNSDEATLTEPGLRRDAQASLEWLRARTDIDHKKIFVLGSSLGGAVSIALAHSNPDKIAGLIIENTFTCIADMALVLVQDRIKLGRAAGPLKAFLFFFLTNRWENYRLVPQLRVPILFISGLADELIPPAHMRRLYDLATNSKQRLMHLVPEGDHNGTFHVGGQAYYDAIQQFISSLLH